ncbi:MAG: hypothetical protein QM756_40180 [Polyangiaceae bacterium]
MREGRLIGALLLASALWARPGFAQEPIPLHIDDRAASTCAPRADFKRLLQARTARVRWAAPAEPAMTLRVSVVTEAVGYSGMLEIEDVEGSRTQRSIQGATCDEVLSGLALSAAVLVDPLASGEARVQRVPTSKRRSAPAARLQGGLAVGVGLHQGFAPNAVIAEWIEARFGVRRSELRDFVLVVSFERTQTERAATPSGVGVFNHWGLHVGACSLRWPADAELAARVCGGLDAGALDARGEMTVRPETQRKLWLAPTLSGRIEAEPLKQLFLSLEGGLKVPLVRHRFYFEPEGPATTAFEVPNVGFYSNVGVGVAFP